MRSNILLIVGKGPFAAYDINAEAGLDMETQKPVFRAINLEQAMIAANKYVELNEVRFGYRFIDMI